MSEEQRDTTVLVRRLQEGDHSARRELIAHSCNRLRELSCSMLRDYPVLRGAEQTDDVLAGAVIRLTKALESVTPESSAHYYNIAAQHIRWELNELARLYHGNRPRHLTNAGQGEGDPLGNLQAKDEPDRAAEWAEFQKLVEALPDAEREVFHLLWYHELSQEQAATVLGISLRSVRRRWQAARVSLGGGGSSPKGGDQ